ncbi:MAG TPA: T9SS type A sorting domain-containing protein [Saprospiraceae bacterium]|nr:T9SS type A sorting domain-containing protein [Saprospiraceae bacterium]
MVKTDFYTHGRWRLSLWLMALSFLFNFTFYNKSYSQSIACNDLVQVSLDENCEALITPEMVLEGETGDVSGFSVKISGISGNIISSPGSYSVTVTNPANGNSCWGNLSVEDKLPPQIVECPCEIGGSDPNCQFLCVEEQGILNGSVSVPTPVVEENCGTYTTVTSDEVIDAGCGAKYIRRTYVFTDSHGNQSSSCTMEYALYPATLGDVMPPVNPIIMTCGSNTSMQGIVDYFTPSVGYETALTYAYPTVNGQAINSNLCNLVAAKTDTETPACGNGCSASKKVIRSWLVLDWCTSLTMNYIQVIKAADTEAPTIAADGFTVSVDPWGCVGNFYMPAPKILHDNCSDAVNYTVTGPIGINITFDVSEQKYLVQGAPKGSHTFNYVASDCCGNTSVASVTVDIVDHTAPIAVAKQNIVISLTNSGNGDGIAKLFANSVDNGSFDGCSAVHLEVRREDDPTRDEDGCGYTGNFTYNADGHTFDGSTNPNSNSYDPDNGAYVKFCCADLTDVEGTVAYGIVKVWLRVWDDGDMDGVYGSDGDNFNETWAYVRVEDKLPPQITCPAEVTISCSDDCNDLSLVGEATASSNCLTLETTYSDIEYLDACGSGYVLRRWSVVNAPSIFCVQRINKVSEDPFDGDDIDWPSDETTDCLNLPDVEVPTWSSGPCDLIGFSLESDTFKFEEGACFKIVNHWTVIDWCQYEPNGFDDEGIWHHIQIIKVVDNVAPVLTCENQMFAVNDNSDVDNDGDKCETRQLMLTNHATDNGDCASSWLKWTILVDLWGDGTWEYEYSSLLPASDNSFSNDTNGNGIPDRYVSPTASGQDVKITIPEDIYGSMANHIVQWKVSDGCGNITSCTNTFMVVDKKAPTPYCVNLSSALMVNGQVELWARDFDLGSFDNCTAKPDLLFTFDGAHPVLSKINQEHYFKGAGENATLSQYNSGNAQKWVPETNSSAKIFDCDDMPEAEVKMSVWDEKMNTDYCLVYLNLLDNQGVCGEGLTANISGNIVTESGEEIAGTTVNLIGELPELSRVMADEDNGYTFKFVPMNLDYNVTAENDTDYTNGVSTLDIVLIQRHILGLAPFTSPYQIIAADATNDEKVTASDLIQIRKLVLGLVSKFDNDSWRFVDASNAMDINHLYPLDEIVNIDDLHTDMQNQNLVGIKIGDVNKTVELNLAGRNSDNRSNTTVTMVTEDQLLSAGQTFSIELNLENTEKLYGMQLELNTNGLELLDIASNVFDVNVQDVNLTNNKLILSTTSPNGVLANTGILTLTVKANRIAKLSDLLSIDNTMLKSEAYIGDDIKTAKLNLQFNGVENSIQEFKLFQNEPNPFIGTTEIKFFIPTTDVVNLTVYNIDGKVVYNLNKEFNSGENSITIDKNTLGGSGVYYYSIESGSYSDTKKMISLE